MLQVRDVLLAAHQAASKNFDKKAEIFEKQPSPVRAKERDEAQQKAKEAFQKYQEISSRSRIELSKFLGQTNQTFHATLVEFSRLNMDSGLLIVDQWKALMKHLIADQ